MKRIFIILLFFVSLSITAEELHNLTDDVTDIRNKVWFYGTNFPDPEAFRLKFYNQFVKRIIIKDSLVNLYKQNSICKSLIDRGSIPIPEMTSMIEIICNDKYGIFIYWWNDTSSFGNFQDTGLREMLCYFFEIK